MAQIEEKTHSKSKKYLHKRLLRVDLTPMVDLGFLLITFFVLTTSLSEPTAAALVMPKDSSAKTLVKGNAVLTLMLMRNDSIAWYEGASEANPRITYCRFNELRSVIQQKQKKVASILGDRNETIIIIYPGKESTYKNFMDVMDEVNINDITHYFVVNHPE
jgi:biopolymer transport protein ExbD